MGIVSFPYPQDRAPAPRRPGDKGLMRRLPLWRDRRALRRILRDELLPQPDSVLCDAGWSRAAAMAEAAKPFWRR